MIPIPIVAAVRAPLTSKRSDGRRQPGRLADGTGHELREHEPEDHTGEGAGDAQQEGAAEHEAAQLEPRRTRGAEQPDLTGALADGHGQGVDDEEGADEQDDRGDERGRRLEGARGCTQAARDVARRRQDVRLGHPRFEALHDGRERIGLELQVDPGRTGQVEGGAGDVDRDDDRAPRARERPEAGQDPDDPQVLGPERAEERELAAEAVAVLLGELLADEGDGLVHRVELGTARKRQVVQAEVGTGVDAEDRDRVGGAAERRARRERPVLDDGRGVDDAIGRRDRFQRVLGQAGLVEAGHPEVRAADHVPDRPVHGLVERGAERQRRRQDGDAERDAEDGEQRSEWPRGDRAPRQPVETHGLEADRGQSGDERRRRMVGTPAQRDLLLDAAVADDEHAVRVRRGACVVGHEDDGLAALVARAPEGVEQLAAVRVVEVAGGLVGEEDRRPRHERASHGDALLLAGGQLVRAVTLLAGQLHEVDDPRGPDPSRPSRSRRS